jgi:hypothetical protein
VRVVVVVVLVVVGVVVVVVVVVVGGTPGNVQLASDAHSHRLVLTLQCVPGGQHSCKTGPLASHL